MMRKHLRSIRKDQWGWLLAGACLLVLAGCAAKNDSSKYSKTIESEEMDFDSQKNAPPNAKTLYAMAEILAAQGKDKESEFIYRRCILEFPFYLPAYSSLAELFTRQGRTDEAIQWLAKGLEINDNDPVILNNLGICHIIRRDFDRAFKYFLGAATIRPAKERYRANLATALGLLGRDVEALALLQQVLPPEDALYNAEVLRKARSKADDTEVAQELNLNEKERHDLDVILQESS